MNTELVVDACLLQAFVPEYPYDLGQGQPRLIGSVGEGLLVKLPEERGLMIRVEDLLNKGAVKDELAPPVLGGLEVPVHLANRSDLGNISHRADIGLKLLSSILA